MILVRVAAAPAAEERTAWFSEARYGLFIHWGLSAVPAGSYRGKPIDRGPETGNGLGEWIMYNAKIPVAEYAGYAKQFNPVKFDAEAWVRLAEAAGMKYIVITAKHHDGFAMFKSAASPFNIVDATPFGRDPLQELAAACARHGIRLGFYYSQAQDWHHPGGSAKWGAGYNSADRPPNAGHWDKAQDGDFDDYLTQVSLPQVKELLTHYGPIAEFWWDSPHGMTPERAARFAELLKLQPHLITNNRLLNPRQANAFSGDTETPEQFIPSTGIKDRLFEVCMTMNESWGYKAHDQNWKPAADITRKLVDIASKGGNFLLNVGPDAEGVIPAPSVERLQESGRWVHANGESIYGTTASLFRRVPWGRSTTKGNTIYLHVFDWPADGRLIVPGLKTPVQRASLLVSKQPLATSLEGADLIVRLSGPAPDAVATVIKLEFARPPVVEQTLPGPDAKGAVGLPASLAAVVNAYDGNARLMGAGATAYIGAWDHANTTLSWEFAVTQPGMFTLEAEAAAIAPATLSVKSGSGQTTAKLAATAGLEDYRRVTLGSLTIASPGEQSLEIKSLGDDWREVRLRGLRLVPVGAVLPADQLPLPTRIVSYKKVGDVELSLHVFEPPGHRATDRTPAIVLFFGGAWRNGQPSQLYPQCAYLAAHGIWAASAEYRVKSRNNTTPVECVQDGKSAIRYLRSHARELGIDPDHLAAGGASAGGQVAAAAATLTDFDEATDDRAVSPIPDALVLFNPVYDNGPGGWGHEEVAAYWEKISPLHHIHPGMPPAVVFLGRADKNIPVATAEKFQQLMRAAGSRSELFLYDGMDHGFFNATKSDGRYFRDTIGKSYDFLASLGYAGPKPPKP